VELLGDSGIRHGHNRRITNSPQAEADPRVALERAGLSGLCLGSCWQDPSGAGSEPAALPHCDANNMPAGLTVARYLAEPESCHLICHMGSNMPDSIGM
jgi:hypothetical protein